MTLRLVTAPTRPLVDLALVKQHLRVEADNHDEDALIDTLIRAATSMLEGRVQRRFVTQVLEWVTDEWPEEFHLPVAPVAAGGVAWIKYRDVDGTLQTLATTDYVVSPCGPTVEIRPAQGTVFPVIDPDAAEAVVVRFTAGTAPVDAGENVHAAALLLIAHLYANRESVVIGQTVAQLPDGVDALILQEAWEAS